MNKELTGCFAQSLAGHDKCTVYIIVDIDDKYVYLSDGKNRLIENPKKKKIKHVQIDNCKDKNIETIINEHKDLKNEEIKRAIKLKTALFSNN